MGILFLLTSNSIIAQKQPSPKKIAKEQSKLKEKQEEKAQAKHEKRVKFHEKIQTKKTKRRMKKNKRKSDRLYKNKNPDAWYKHLFTRRKKVKKKKRNKY